MDRVRVIRILIYEGERKWVENTLNMSSVKGTKSFGNNNTIKSGIIGDFPDLIDEETSQGKE